MRDPRGMDMMPRDFGREFDRPSRGPPPRRRSPSPDFDRFDRNKRPRRDDYDRGYERRDYSPPSYRGRSPPPRRGGYEDRDYADRRDRDGERGPPRMKTFKEFMLDQPDDPSPDEAQRRYKDYQIEFHGGEVKAEWMDRKNDESFRAMFDPRMFEKALVKRNDEARESAKTVAADIEAGKLDPSAQGFNQGMLEQAEEAKAEGRGGRQHEAPMRAPPLCWSVERVAADLNLSRRLMAKLDAEKDIPAGSNPLLPKPPAAPAPAEAPPAAAAEGGEGSVPPPETGAAAAASSQAAASGYAAITAALAEEPLSVAEDTLAEMTGRLDQHLTYLWRVHGIDYYAGYELTAQQFGERLTACRMLRAQKPAAAAAAAPTAAAAAAPSSAEPASTSAPEGAAEAAAGEGDKAAAEGEGAAAAGAEAADGEEAEAKGDAAMEEAGGEKPAADKPDTKAPAPAAAAAAAATVERRPGPRGGREPSEAVQRDQLVRTVDRWWEERMDKGDPLVAQCLRKKVEDAVEEWVESQVVQHGENKWGNKLSVKQFVGKKFVLKHIRAKFEDKINEQKEKIYEDLFLDNFKAFKAAEEERMRMEHEGYGDDDWPMRGGRGGRGRGRGGRFGGPMGGRGRGPPMVPMMPMMDPRMVMVAVPGPMGPMLVPAPMGPLPLLPGGPMMMGPPMGGGRGPRRGGPPGGPGGRGGRGGRGPMMVGPGAKPEAGGVREYYDLDNPHNNRAVLDYGDL